MPPLSVPNGKSNFRFLHNCKFGLTLKLLKLIYTSNGTYMICALLFLFSFAVQLPVFLLPFFGMACRILWLTNVCGCHFLIELFS